MKKSSKKWPCFAFDLEEKKPNGIPLVNYSSSDNFITKSENRAPEKRNFNFQERLAPKVVDDLAVHSKKIAEVETWLQNNVCNESKNTQTANFLLITGPTGSGKSITLQVLCKKLSIDVTEWVNPMDQDFEVFKGQNQITRFMEFLTESKWNSLFSTGNKKIILVEDFPNVLIRNPEDFNNVLEETYYKGNYPVVFTCTESFDNKTNLIEKLFSQSVRDKFGIFHITFNACASTLMKNALKRAHTLIQDNLDLFKTPSPSTVNAIISTSMGDIKCAINQYYFASLLGSSDLPIVTQKPSGTKRKRSTTSTSIQMMARDENLGLFHGLGRVLNPKRAENGNSWRLSCDFDKLIDEFSTQPGIFTAFLFENYLKYFGDISDVSEASEILSLSQTFLEKWVDRHDILTFALWISVLGLMVHNEHRVSRWNQIRAPVKTPKRLNNDFATRNLSVTDLYYYNIINKIENSGFKG